MALLLDRGASYHHTVRPRAVAGLLRGYLRSWVFAVLAILTAVPLGAQVTGTSTAPGYSALSIVNGATQTVEALAPNTIATIYGTNLATSTHAVGTADIVHGLMPTNLDGVAVWINGSPCGLYLVSPTQINFLVPSGLTAGIVTLLVARDSTSGPGVAIALNSTSPGIFLWNGNDAVATHLNGQLLSSAAPATAGEIVVIYAAGLGQTTPLITAGQLATSAATIQALSQLHILLDGVATAAGSILYAGLAPGYAGLYQINLRLPSPLPVNPQIQLSVGSLTSPASILLVTH